MNRYSRSCIIALAVASTAACGSDSLGPRADATPETASLRIITRHRTATSADITVDSKGGKFNLGQHSIRFPKNSICSLTSSYGPAEWDKPCTPATEPVTFHVEIVIQDGRQWLDFTPAVRFVPTTNPKQYVTLAMSTFRQSDEVSEDDLQILWSPAIGVPGVDESIDDPTLRTTVNRRSGKMSRRVKHFSGFSVSDGVACEPTDTSCVKDVALGQ